MKVCCLHMRILWGHRHRRQSRRDTTCVYGLFHLCVSVSLIVSLSYTRGLSFVIHLTWDTSILSLPLGEPHLHLFLFSYCFIAFCVPSASPVPLLHLFLSPILHLRTTSPS